MIEVTDEMREAFQVAAGWPGPPWRFGPDVVDGLAAVLAIVERDVAHALLEGREAQDRHAGEHGPMVEVISACPWCPPFVADFPEIMPPSPRAGHGSVEPIEAPGMSALTDEEFAALEGGER